MLLEFKRGRSFGIPDEECDQGGGESAFAGQAGWSYDGMGSWSGEMRTVCNFHGVVCDEEEHVKAMCASIRPPLPTHNARLTSSHFFLMMRLA